MEPPGACTPRKPLKRSSDGRSKNGRRLLLSPEDDGTRKTTEFPTRETCPPSPAGRRRTAGGTCVGEYARTTVGSGEGNEGETTDGRTSRLATRPRREKPSTKHLEGLCFDTMVHGCPRCVFHQKDGCIFELLRHRAQHIQDLKIT